MPHAPADRHHIEAGSNQHRHMRVAQSMERDAAALLRLAGGAPQPAQLVRPHGRAVGPRARSGSDTSSTLAATPTLRNGCYSCEGQLLLGDRCRIVRQPWDPGHGLIGTDAALVSPPSSIPHRPAIGSSTAASRIRASTPATPRATDGCTASATDTTSRSTTR